MTAVLLHGNAGAAPIYDGISLPSAPYRYESPPPSAQNGNQKPLSAQVTVSVKNGTVPLGTLGTDDTQVLVFWGTGSLKASSAATVTCRIDPVASPPAAPAGIEIRGNVYNITCVAPAGGTAASSPFDLTLRLPPGLTNDIRYYDGRTWHTLVTTFGGAGIPYASAHGPGFGMYAAMARVGAATTDSFLKIITPYLELFGILVFVVIFAVIALVQELRRRRRLRSPKNP